MMKTIAAVTREKASAIMREIPVVIHHRDPEDMDGHIPVVPERLEEVPGSAFFSDRPCLSAVWEGDARRDHARGHLLVR